jgi:hypothetical protein
VVNNNNNNNTFLSYSNFELCLIICSEIVHKDLGQEQKNGKNGGWLQFKTSSVQNSGYAFVIPAVRGICEWGFSIT